MEILLPRSARRWRADALKTPLQGINRNLLKDVTVAKFNILVLLPGLLLLVAVEVVAVGFWF